MLTNVEYYKLRKKNVIFILIRKKRFTKRCVNKKKNDMNKINKQKRTDKNRAQILAASKHLKTFINFLTLNLQ